ncbi:MAG: ester cyclase [Haloarcula sp.]
MSTTENTNKDIVKRYLHAFNERDLETLEDILADDVVEHGIHEELHGPDEVIEFLESYFERFPDYDGTTDAMVAEGDTVAVRYSATGTHKGEYLDVEPTGHVVEWTGMAMYRLADDNIAEVWVEENRLGLLEQLEAVNPPAHLRI